MKKLLWIYFAAIGTANASDQWWEIRIAGEPAGYQHTTTERLDDGSFRTTERTRPSDGRRDQHFE
jgi:hypothetical protein